MIDLNLSLYSNRKFMLKKKCIFKEYNLAKCRELTPQRPVWPVPESVNPFLFPVHVVGKCLNDCLFYGTRSWRRGEKDGGKKNPKVLENCLICNYWGQISSYININVVRLWLKSRQLLLYFHRSLYQKIEKVLKQRLIELSDNDWHHLRC